MRNIKLKLSMQCNCLLISLLIIGNIFNINSVNNRNKINCEEMKAWNGHWEIILKNFDIYMWN